MHPRRSEAIAMRQAGKSFNEISRKLGINKSTLSYMLHEVQLTKAQLDVLDARRKASVKYLIKFMAGLSSEEKRSRGREAGRRAWREHKQQMTANLSRGRAIANLTYRKDELPVKEKLERLYSRTFSKEEINGRIVDFSCEDLIIEYTTDNTHGVFDLIRRLEAISGDTRRKIAYLPLSKLGVRSKERLGRVAEVIDYLTLA